MTNAFETPPFLKTVRVGLHEEAESYDADPFWAPFSWMLTFAAGAEFWRWIIDQAEITILLTKVP